MDEYQNFDEKDLNFDQLFIDKPDDFNEICYKYQNSTGFLFRGLSEAKYKLYNSLQRFWVTKKLKVENSLFEDFVIRLVENAKGQSGKALIKYLQHWNPAIEWKNWEVNDLAILSILQHYGCPTPLMDWTYSFVNSLYFAADEVKNFETDAQVGRYLSIYLIDKKNLKRIIPDKDVIMSKIDLTGEDAKPWYEYDGPKLDIFPLLFFSKVEHFLRHPCLLLSDYNDRITMTFNNLNIINQKGAFTWNNHPTMPFEEVLKDQQIVQSNSRLLCINVNKKLMSCIKNKLVENGITESFIYPDPRKIAEQALENTLNELG